MNHVCGYCQKEFSSTSKKSRFCSLPCSYKKINAERKEKLREEYYANPRHCECCYGPLSFEQKNVKNAKYCSQSCAATMTNKLREGVAKRGNLKTELSGKYVLTTISCSHCKADFAARANRLFCSRRCAFDHKFIEKLKEFENGFLSPKAGRETLKKCLIHRDGEICKECGQLPRHNGKFLCLQVDHIDGNADNNHSNNLRLLCPNCHTQTPTFCGGNSDSARNKYRQKWRSK